MQRSKAVLCMQLWQHLALVPVAPLLIAALCNCSMHVVDKLMLLFIASAGPVCG
jgi:hypothetical protein